MKISDKTNLFLQKNSGTILTIMGSLGVIATAASSIKATIKAVEITQEASSIEYSDNNELCFSEPLTPKEVVQLTWKCYIPTVLVATSTIVCINGANLLNKKKQTSLISAYGMLDTAYREYRNKTKELYGDEADKLIRTNISNDINKKQKLKTTGRGVVFYEPYSRTFFERTMEEVLDAQYHLNRNMTLRSYASLNEFYEFLGLPTTDYGNEIGWSILAGEEFYGYSWIDFTQELCKTSSGEEYYTIKYDFIPTTDYMNY